MMEKDSSEEAQASSSPHSCGAHWTLFTAGGGGEGGGGEVRSSVHKRLGVVAAMQRSID